MKVFARYSFWALGLALMVTSMAMIGCGSKDGGGGPAPGVAAPGIITTNGGGAGGCQVNQLNTAHGCLYINSCVNNTAWLPGANECVAALPSNVGSPTSGSFMASLSVNDPSTYAMMLQNFRLCEPNYTYGYYFGGFSCDSYSHSGHMLLQMQGVVSGVVLPATAIVTLAAGANYPGAPNSNWTTGGAVKRFAFSTNLAYANGNAGFTGAGPYGFRFVVNSGLPGNSYQLNVDLQYNGTTFARGVLTRQ